MTSQPPARPRAALLADPCRHRTGRVRPHSFKRPNLDRPAALLNRTFSAHAPEIRQPRIKFPPLVKKARAGRSPPRAPRSYPIRAQHPSPGSRRGCRVRAARSFTPFGVAGTRLIRGVRVYRRCRHKPGMADRVVESPMDSAEDGTLGLIAENTGVLRLMILKRGRVGAKGDPSRLQAR